MSAKNKPNELSITRIYEASVQHVWDAWVDPKKAAKWWGPRGFTITTHSKDLRPGGMWHYTMHGPDGTDWINKTIYLEVEKYQKLVYDHGGNDEQAPLFRVTVLFTETKGKTKMEMTMAFPSADVVPGMKKFIKEAGGNSTWDRLGEYLDKQIQNKERFIINRSFEAGIERVFEMWSKSEHLEKWLAPTNVSMKILKGELKEGGEIDYSMTGQDLEMFGRISYEQIRPVSLITYSQVFLSRDGKVSRHPHTPTWPERIWTRVEFAAEGENETRITLTWEPIGNVTEAEWHAFIDAKRGMAQGWTGSLDKLETLLIG